MKMDLKLFCFLRFENKNAIFDTGTQREVESNSLQSRHVWLYNASSPRSPWMELAPLQVKRMNHACGTFMVDGKKRVIVAGGDNRDRTSISNVRHPEWFDFEVGPVLNEYFSPMITYLVMYGFVIGTKVGFVTTNNWRKS